MKPLIALIFNLILVCLIIVLNQYFIFVLIAGLLLFVGNAWFYRSLLRSIRNMKDSPNIDNYQLVDDNAQTDVMAKKKELEKKYQDLLVKWTLMTENVSHMFHKASDVALATMVQFDTVDENFSKIEHLNSATGTVKQIIQQIESEINSISENSDQINQATDKSSQKVSETRSIMENINFSNQGLKTAIDNFIANMKSIEQTLLNITQISNKTRTLSINAAIEATKAGAHGSGFSVLAKEIRTLAENTNYYTKNIYNLLTQIKVSSQQVLISMDDNSSNIDKGLMFVSDTTTYIKDLTGRMSSINGMIQTIKKRLSEQNANMLDIFNNFNELHQISGKTKVQSEKFLEISNSLSVLGEESINTAIKVPNRSVIYKLVNAASRMRYELEEAMLAILDNTRLTDKQLFEPEFTLVPNTLPERYECAYQPVLLETLQPILEKYKQEHPYIVNITINDLNNYVSVCLKEYSKPLTGDLGKDVFNLIRRIYKKDKSSIKDSEVQEFRTNKINQKTAENDFFITSYVFKQANMTLSDLAFPIYIRGRHWGSGRIGFYPDKIK